MKVFKTCLKVFFICLLLGYFASSCSYAWTFDQFMEFVQQVASNPEAPTNFRNNCNILLNYKNNLEAVADLTCDNWLIYNANTTGWIGVYAYKGQLQNVTISSNGLRWTKVIMHNYIVDRGNGSIPNPNATTDVYYTSSNVCIGLLNLSTQDEDQIPQTMWLQNRYMQGFEFTPHNDGVVTYNGYQDVNAIKIKYFTAGTLLGRLTKLNADCDYYRYVFLDSNGNRIAWLNYHIGDSYYSSENMEMNIETGNIFVETRLLYVNNIYTLAIYGNNEPLYDNVSGAKDSQVLTYVPLRQNAVITGNTITYEGSGDSYTIQDSTNDLINNLYNDGSGDSPGIVQQIYDDLFTLKEDDFDNIYSYAATLFPSGDVMAVNEIIFSTLHPSGDDFVIAWDNIPINFSLFGGVWSYSGDFIAANSINFSKACRDNEQLGLLRFWINVFMQVSFSLAYIYAIYKCILIVIGVSTELVPETEDRKPIGFMQGGYHK